MSLVHHGENVDSTHDIQHVLVFPVVMPIMSTNVFDPSQQVVEELQAKKNQTLIYDSFIH